MPSSSLRSKFKNCWRGDAVVDERDDDPNSPPPAYTPSASASGGNQVAGKSPAPVSHPSSSTGSNAAFLRALETHKNSLTDQERLVFEKVHATCSPEALITRARALDSEHAAGSKARKCAARVSGVLDGVNGYMSALTLCTGHDPYSAIVLGGVKCVIDFALKFPGFFNNLTGMMEQIFETLEYMSNYASPVFLDSSEIQNALEKTYRDLLIFCKKARRVFTNDKGETSAWTSMKLMVKVTWQPFEAEFTDLHASFLSHAEIVVKHAQGQEFVAAKLYRQIQELKDQKADAEYKDKRRRDALHWISDIDYEDVHEAKYEKRQKYTGTWLLESSEFRAFKQSPQSSVLWCNGKPGVGKSVVAATVLNDLTEIYPASEDVGIAFAYCDFKNPQSAKTLLAAFIKQLARRLKQLPHILDELYTTHSRDNRDASYEELLTVLQSMLNEFEDVYIVLDALDECVAEQRSKVLSLCDNIISSSASKCKVKIFVTSRKEIDIERRLNKLKTRTIEIGPVEIEQDIITYVDAQIERRLEDGSLMIEDPETKNYIREALTKRSDSMFLWVVLQLERICRLTSDEEIREALDTLPRNIEETYRQILNKIEQQERKQAATALKMIQLVAYACRPLKIDELVEAIGMDPRFTKKEEIPARKDPEQLLHLCGNLLVVDWEKHVRFIHFSVQEYIDSAPADMLKLGELFHKEKANKTLATICLTYLNFSAFDKPCDTQWDLNVRKLEYRLFQYACTHWADHVRMISDVDSILLKSIKNLFASKGKLESIMQVLESTYRLEWLPIPGHLPASISPYSTATFFNLPSICEKFDNPALLKPDVVEWIILLAPPGALQLALDSDVLDVNCLIGSDEKKTVLYVAAECNNDEAVRLLLVRGAAANVAGGKYGSPLVAAAYNGNYEVVKLLLDQGADVNMFGGELGSAFTAAALNANINTVKLLLDSGSDVNGQGGKYGTPLQAAALNVLEKVFDILLDRGANIHAPPSGIYGTALQAAASIGDIYKMKRLLERRVDVNALGGKYGNAMQAAANWGNVSAMQLLIDHGADIVGHGGSGIYGNSLQAAAEQGSDAAVKFLLDRGVDPNLLGGQYGTAIQAAANYGAVDVIVRLAYHGADVNLAGAGVFGTALQAAVYRGRLDVVTTLLRLGADVNLEGHGPYGTALQAAAYTGETEVVRLLLDNGAKKNSGGGKYGSPLAAAKAPGPSWKPPKTPESVNQIVKLIVEYEPAKRRLEEVPTLATSGKGSELK